MARSFQESTPKDLQDKTLFVSSLEANFERPKELKGFLDHLGPQVVVICAAYTQVDKAEEERELAEKINFRAPQEIARWSALNDALLVHFSTDYVFPGGGTVPWKETDFTGPMNWYGETKLEGEDAIRNSTAKHLIFRTSWLYSEYGKNFLRTMLRLGKEKEKLQIVSDQVGGPTYTVDMARLIWPLLRDQTSSMKASGTYHLAGQGFASWAQFAEQIFQEAKAANFDLKVQSVEKILSMDYPTLAHRPLNSRFDQSKVKQAFGIEMPQWQDSLRLCLQRMGAP